MSARSEGHAAHPPCPRPQPSLGPGAESLARSRLQPQLTPTSSSKDHRKRLKLHQESSSGPKLLTQGGFTSEPGLRSFSFILWKTQGTSLP